MSESFPYSLNIRVKGTFVQKLLLGISPRNIKVNRHTFFCEAPNTPLRRIEVTGSNKVKTCPVYLVSDARLAVLVGGLLFLFRYVHFFNCLIYDFRSGSGAT